MSRRGSPSEHLRALARRVADAHVEETRPRAALLVGSAAAGVADRFSDLDLILYYDELPCEDASTARASAWAAATCG